MKRFLIALLMVVNIVHAKDSEAQKLCDAEIKKEQPQENIIQKQCAEVAKEYELKKEYVNASWYYLLKGDNEYNINKIKHEIKNDYLSNIGHSYILNGKLNNAREMYIRYLKSSSMHWLDASVQDAYELLYKLYPLQKEHLNRGLVLWNEIYEPLIEIKTLYIQYLKAKARKKTKQAIKYLTNVIDLQKKYQNKDNIYIYDNLYDLGKLYSLYTDDHNKILDIWHQVEKVYELNEFRQERYVYLLNRMAVEYYNLHKYKKSISYLKKSLISAKKVLGNEDPFVFNIYRQISKVYWRSRNYSKSIKFYKQFLSSKEKLLNKDDLSIIKNYKYMVQICLRGGDYKNLITYQHKILNIQETFLGKDHKDTIERYGRLASSYVLIKDYEKEMIYLNKALSVSKNKAKWYIRIARTYRNNRNYPESLSYYQKALLLNKKHDRNVMIYEEVAYIYFLSMEYSQALKYYKRALNTAEKFLGENHEDTLAIYDELSNFYGHIGKPTQQIIYTKKALAIREKIFKEDDILLAKSYGDIASFYVTMNEYTKALSYYQKSLNIRKKVLPGSMYNINYMGENNNLAYLYYLMGDKEEALKHYQKTLSLDEKSKFITERTYEHMAEMYKGLGDYNTALSYLKKVLKIRKVNNNVLMIPFSYRDIGLLYSKVGDYTKALSYIKEAMKVDKNISSEKGFYGSLAQVYEKMGDLNNALKYYKKGLLYLESTYGKKNVFVMQQNFIIGKLYKVMENYPKAYENIRKSFNYFLKNRNEIFTVLDNKQKNNFLEKNSNRIANLFSAAHLYIESNNILKDLISKSTFDSWLNYKGSIFDSENAIIMLYDSTEDQTLRDKIDTLLITKRKLAKLYQSLPKSKGKKTWNENIKDKEEKIGRLTNEISNSVSTFTEQEGLKSVSYKDISAKLKDNELYIDYAKVEELYYVFSLDNNETIIFKTIDKNTSKRIDTLVEIFRKDMVTILNENNTTNEELKQLTRDTKDELSELYELVLNKPLNKPLRSKTSLIISPDGALRLLPFEAMFDKVTKKYFIEEKEIRYVPSGKELVRLYRYANIKSDKENDTTVIFSNPNFNVKLTKLVNVDKEESMITSNTSRAGIIKSLFRMRFAPLPGTKEEAESIKQTLHAKEVIEYTEGEATEYNLMNVKDPNILHIATHGFFINDNTIPNPMLKSGIALAGANKSVIKGKSDGVVTALKLSGLKLKETDLVVLSACQTGVVDINSTDSVSGLCKAFIQAGAKDIVMSLWSVNDQATKDLMSSFYQEMQRHPSYAKALKEAKLKMIEKDMHPFYWAPFIVNGL